MARLAVACAWLGSAIAGGLVPTLVRAAEPYCENNPSVIYCNDFESGDLDGLEAGPAIAIVTAGDGAPVYAGERSLLADFAPPYNAQAEFGLRFAGVERVYVRFYMRFDAAWDEPMHHFYAIHGDHPDDAWSCHGDAGCRPNGEICLSGTTVDTREVVDGQLPGEPFFYTYHPDMNCDPEASCQNYSDPQTVCDGCATKGLPCENGLECCWGNWFDINQDVAVSMGQEMWIEIETMVAANTPGMDDGEMALWVDGQLVAQHGGIGWRNTSDLLLNHFIVWNYYRSVSAARRIWFDNLVISTAPIGARDPGSGTGGPTDDTAGPSDDTGAAADDAATDPSASATASATGASADSATSDDATTAPDARDDSAGGCGCRSTPRPWLALLLPLAGPRRRRKHAHAAHRSAGPAR